MRGVATAVFLLLACFTVAAQEAGSGRLGVEITDLTKEEAEAQGWDEPRGARVVKPVPGRPAETAGLMADDIIVSLDGLEIENAQSLDEALGNKAAGAEIRLSIRRARREKRFGITLGARPAEFAVAERKPLGPQLMLDTGGHMAIIMDIAFTSDGKQLVSASEDKTVRVWDLATGKTVRTIRGESAPGPAGKIFAMALSPDSKWLAIGGFTGPECSEGCGDIRLYDFATGRLVALLKGHESVVLGLAFSPDGRNLISGSADKTAIVWDAERRVLKHRLRGHGDNIHAVGFTPDGQRAVTGSFDRDLRLWRVADGKQIGEPMTGHGDKVRALAVTPDGVIVSGDWSGEIRLWDGRAGAFFKVLARQGTAVGSLSVSPDGKRLLSGTGGTANHQVYVYDLASGAHTAYSGHNNIVVATAISPDGRWAATGGGANKEIHLWSLRTFERRLSPDGEPLTLGGQGRPTWAVGFSADGQRIAWGNAARFDWVVNDIGPLQHLLDLPSAAEDFPRPRPIEAEKAGGFRHAIASRGGWSLGHRKGGNYGGNALLDIKRNRKLVTTIERTWDNGTEHRSYSLTPDGETIISGGNNGLLVAYDRTGNKLGNFTGHESEVWAVAPSPDGRFLVSGSDDQTVRLWNLNTRELLVTLFLGANGEWVMWTPGGYFAGSGRGSDMAGWLINRGPDQVPDYVTAGQLRRWLNRPDVLARTIALGSEEAALRELKVTGFKLEDLLARPVPRFSIASPKYGASVGGGSAIVRLDLSAIPDPIRRIRIRVNGRQIADVEPSSAGAFQAGALPLSVDLAEGRNEVSIIATNDIGEATQTITLNHQGEGDLDKRGTLYLIAIGVDKYPSAKPLAPDLRYAGADAEAFFQTMEKRLGPRHEKVVRRLLTNGKTADAAPTRANIVDALAILGKAQPNDTVVVFLAGHGISEGLNYRFIPTDAQVDKGALRTSSLVSWFAIKEAMDAAKGRRILFLDTCHSANAYNARLDDDVYHADILAYASAQGDQLALEDAGIGHGLFTEAVVEGLNGAAAGGEGKRVMTDDLGKFVASWVKERAAKRNHLQEPQMYRGKDAGNYLLTRLQ